MGGKKYQKKKEESGSSQRQQQRPPQQQGQQQQRPPQQQRPQQQQGQQPQGQQQRPPQQQWPQLQGQQRQDQQQRPPQQQRPQQQQGQQRPPQQQGQQRQDQQQRPPQQQQGQQRPPQQQLNEQFDRMSVSSGEQRSQQQKPVTTKMGQLLCPFKGIGTAGRKVEIEVNYLKILMDNMPNKAYHYDVQIDPDKPKKNMIHVFQQFCIKNKNFGGVFVAYDGVHSAYSPRRLDLNAITQNEVDFLNSETGGIRKYTVKIKETDDAEIPLDALKTYAQSRQYDMPRRALQCLEVILKGAFQQKQLNKDGMPAGRSFFLKPSKPEYLGDFYELWFGLFQSTVLGRIPYLNVDITHKAFPKKYATLVDLLKDIQQESRDRDGPERCMERHLSGLDVIYKSPGGTGQSRAYKFKCLRNTPDKEKFKDADNKIITIAQYFKDRKYPIHYPNYPCVELGNNVKSITVPMEHCWLSDRQAVNKKNTENQTRNIIRCAATSTDVRKQKIYDVLNKIQHNKSEIIQNFGLELDKNFAKIPARLLDSPLIEYNQNKKVKVINGVWRAEGFPFLIPESANAWAILNANNRTRRNELEDLSKMLLRVSKPTNLNLAERPTFIRDVDSRNIRNIIDELQSAKESGIRILFCIIPDSGKTYNDIKQKAELQVGVLTQCIKGGTVFKKRNDGSTISNIILKVNAKLNGTNHRLNTSPILNNKCMLIGADVTHPSPDQKFIPSVVGTAASHDANAFCYNFSWRLQGPRVEIIEDFQQIVEDHLSFYKRKNNCLPEKIIYYRDGVSEGQFQEVMGTERQAMIRACARIEPGYEKRVKMTIIVVQKRHHTRFFPGQSGIGQHDRKNNNVPAGTIVDTEITHPNENHFYLVSHQSIQGVAKPTKYCILLDEANHKIDDLQGLSYNLCHLFSRCNRSVSYPAPTYYAHLAAYRGRIYIETERNINMKSLQSECQKRAIKDNIIKGHPMFFI